MLHYKKINIKILIKLQLVIQLIFFIYLITNFSRQNILKFSLTKKVFFLVIEKFVLYIIILYNSIIITVLSIQVIKLDKYLFIT